ncbi:glycosyltransferase family 4 protein [Halocynthiibacter sp. C4]|uniref:glycosyltransferase family 4 protein n=1 Tax=Halocynthiibacter sp. C4 TaxID=2992758 RepID=UPI00237AB7E0|nr:glycosyltransferase family 4 protein [Halocynthiibacter sp. C4]MDE0589455.1 glycosyltransferase family 4 protein [Halocynthiibacter sp. C4]
MKQDYSGRKIAVIASLGTSLVNFRLELLKRMVANGHEVLALAPEFEPETIETLAAYGIQTKRFAMDRAGLNPVKDLQTIHELRSIFKAFKPDVIVPYTAKPIVYANLAARMAGVPRRFGLFTGLGYAFLNEQPRGKQWLVRQIAIYLYRLSSKGMIRAFTYNPKETEDLRDFRLVPPSTPVQEVPGSGVDVALYKDTVPSVAPIKFLMIARLLKSKGVRVFVAAAARLKAKGLEFEANLLGPMDPNPDGITQEQLDGWIREGTINYLGATKDVKPYLADCSVMVLPSMYREGIPRSILEAMSSGRAVITSDMPGCAHSITDQEDGFIVPTGDDAALADAMEKFISAPDLAIQMGASGRAHAERTFDVHKVNRILLTEMGLEDPDNPPTLLE